MIVETGKIRVVFTVTCGAQNNENCPSEEKLQKLRKLTAPGNQTPQQKEQWKMDRDQLVNSLKAKLDEHPAPPEEKPGLLEIAHYRVERRAAVTNEIVEVGRDVFVGIAEVYYKYLNPDPATGLLEIREPEGRQYLNEMFRLIFQDLDEENSNWLTWVMVPLVEAFDGRFNPSGMGGDKG